ncbi:MAG: site-specific integrase [Fusobacteriaceae bacterium]|jgi:integrase|nr:site-specific integrase [Fusobacteriaceae bacterium]
MPVYEISKRKSYQKLLDEKKRKNKSKKNWGYKFQGFNPETGKKKAYTKEGFLTKDEAEKAERIRKNELEALEKEFKENGCLVKPFMFSELIEKFLLESKSRVRPGVQRNKEVFVRNHIMPDFGHYVASKISNYDIIEWQTRKRTELSAKTGQPYEKTTLRSMSSILSGIFNFGIKIKKLAVNPLRDVKHMGTARTQHEMSFLTLDEFKTFIAAFDDSTSMGRVYKLIFEVLFGTGMRIGELLALRVMDVDLENSIINVRHTYIRLFGHDLVQDPKTVNGKRQIAITPSLKDSLKTYIDRLVDPDPQFRLFPCSKDQIERQKNWALREAFGIVEGTQKIGKKGNRGYPGDPKKFVRLHDFRHSHVSLLISKNMDVILIAKRLGHASPDITQKIYGHLYPHKEREMINELMKLNL